MADVLPFPNSEDPEQNFIWRNQQDATVRAMSSSDENPDDAARAHALSQATGVSPSVIRLDQDDFEKKTKDQLTTSLIKSNPHLQQYVNSHPLAASISNDDWGALHDLSEAMKAHSLPGRIFGTLGAAPKAIESAFEGLGSIYSAGKEEAFKGAEEARKKAVQAYIDDPWIPERARKAYPEFSALLDSLSNLPLPYVIRKEYEMFGGPMGLISMAAGNVTGFGYGALRQAVRQFGGSESTAEQIAREFAAMAETEMMGMSGRGHLGEPAEAIVRGFREDRLARETGEALTLAKPYLDRQEVPPAGLHPFIDRARDIMAKIDGDQIESAAKLAQKTNTWARDKDFQLQHFLSMWPDSHIEVPADIVQQLYGTKPITPDDGILGWVPNLREQLETSALTGQKIEISRNQWITHADPEIRKALKEHASWRPGARSEVEAKEAEALAPELMESQVPEITEVTDVRRYGDKESWRTGRKDVPPLATNERAFEFEVQGKKGLAIVEPRKEGKDLYVRWVGPGEDAAINVTDPTELRRKLLGPMDLGPHAIAGFFEMARREWPKLETVSGLRASGTRARFGKERTVTRNVADTLDGLHRVTGLLTPEQMAEKLNPVVERGLDFRNLIPPDAETGDATILYHKFPALKMDRTVAEFDGIHHFELREILPLLPRVDLTEASRVLGDFLGRHIEHLAGDIPVHVVTPEEMKAQGFTALGFYDPHHHQIVIRSDMLDGSNPSYMGTHVIMHEAAHAITLNAIFKFPAIRKHLKELMKVTKEAIKGFEGGDELLRQFNNAFKNEREFLAEAISLDHFQEYLNIIQIPDRVAKALKIQPGSMWDAVRQAVKDLWTSLLGKVPDETVMDAIFRTMHSIEELNEHMAEGRVGRPEQMPELMAEKGPPIVQFRKDAERIEKTLPPIKEGYVRLWRGDRPGEIGATRFTSDLPGIALPFRKHYGGELSYVDVPADIAAKHLDTGVVAEGAEYTLPPEIADQAQRVPEDQDLFAARALGMSKKVYTAFKDLALKRATERQKYLAEQVEKADKERQSKEWKDNEAEVRDMVRDHVMHLPDIAADHFLRTGELFGTKYRRSRLDYRYIDRADIPGLDPEHWNPTGLKPDAIAEALGFQSGRQMIDALKNLKAVRDVEGLTPAAHISQMIDALTDREMKERFGRFEESILDSAKEHILGSATQYDILHEHTAYFGEKLGITQPQFTKGDIKAMARMAMSNERVGAINSTRAMKAVGDLGRKIETAEVAGDWDTAFKTSQQREIAFQVANLHRTAEKAIARFQRRGKQFSVREPTAVPIQWSNPIQDILQRVGVAVARTPEDIAREYIATGNGSLADFVRSRAIPDVFGEDPDFPTSGANPLTVAGFLLDPNYRSKDGWKNMSWEEFEAVHNSIESLYANGRKEGKEELGGKIYRHEELVDGLIDILYDVFKGVDPTIDRAVNPATNFKTVWAGLIQMETLWSRLARDDPNNLFMKAINMPIMEAGNNLSAFQRMYAKKWEEIGRFPKDMNAPVENSLFFEPNERGGEIADIPRKMTMRNLLAVLQNVGNWSNFDKMSRGHGVANPNVVKAWHQQGYKMAMNDPVMNWVFKHTTKEDWDRAQALGDLFDEMFTHAENVYYDMGARPGPRIELRSIETPFGTYRGWYNPIVYDSARPMFWTYDPRTGERTPVSRSKITNPMEDAGFYQVATPTGYQKARTGYAAPLLLNFDTIPFRMKQIINDIAMRQVVTEVNKIFSDTRFRTAMSKTYGDHYTKLLKEYLKDIAGQHKYVDPLSQTWGKVGEYIYSNAVGTLIGFNPGTVAKHFMTATMNSAKQVGPIEFSKEFLNTWLNPLGWKNWGFVVSKSDEVARRWQNWRESLTGQYEDIFPGGTPAPLSGALGEQWGARFEHARQAMIRAGTGPVAFSDIMSVVPMWNVVYKREMRAGAKETDAIAKADQAVRYAHGSTAVTARAGVMRTTWGRAISPFYNFFNDMLQRQYETAWRAKDAVGYMKDGNYQKGLSEMGKVASGMWAYVLWPALVEQAISPIVWDDKDHNYLKKGAEIIARDVASSFPLIRDLASLLLSGEDPTFSVYGTAGKGTYDFLRDVQKGEVKFNRAHRGKTIKHFSTMVGFTLGVSNSQMGRWGEFAHDYATGIQRPHGALTAKGLPEWYRALRFGDMKERKKR